MIRLYHAPRACSLAAASLLAHLGVEHELVVLDLVRGDQRRPEHLARNPLGQVPVLEVDDRPLSQSAAILHYIQREFGDEERLPALSSLEQAEVDGWLLRFASVMHVQWAQLWRPERFSDDEALWPGLREAGGRRYTASMTELDRHLTGRDWLVADRLSLADFTAFPYITWLARFLPDGLASVPALAAHLERMLALPAVQSVLARTGLTRESLLKP